MDKIVKFLIGFGLIWICVWGTAADTEGPAWLFVAAMVLVGVAMMAIGLFLGQLFLKE